MLLLQTFSGNRRLNVLRAKEILLAKTFDLRGEWPSGLYSLRQVTEVKLGQVRSISGLVTSKAWPYFSPTDIDTNIFPPRAVL